MTRQPRTSTRAQTRVANAVYRDRDSERDELIRRILDENAALRKDNDILALGIGDVLARVGDLEAQVAVLLDRTTPRATGTNTNPYAVILPPPKVGPAPRRVVAAVNDLRKRLAS